jgi:hypothetical protein
MGDTCGVKQASRWAERTLMKFRCECGHVIYDQTDRLPYKASLLPNQSWARFQAPIYKALTEFAQALSNGTRDGWIVRYFGPAYPRDLDDESVISDFMGRYFGRLRAVYQCEQCGAIFIEKVPGAPFVMFRPTDDDWRGILAWRE